MAAATVVDEADAAADDDADDEAEVEAVCLVFSCVRVMRGKRGVCVIS